MLFFSVLFGVALAQFGEARSSRCSSTSSTQITHVIFRIIGWIMKVAPIGAFGAMAFIIGQYGIASLGTFGS